MQNGEFIRRKWEVCHLEPRTGMQLWASGLVCSVGRPEALTSVCGRWASVVPLHFLSLTNSIVCFPGHLVKYATWAKHVPPNAASEIKLALNPYFAFPGLEVHPWINQLWLGESGLGTKCLPPWTHGPGRRGTDDPIGGLRFQFGVGSVIVPDDASFARAGLDKTDLLCTPYQLYCHMIPGNAGHPTAH